MKIYKVGEKSKAICPFCKTVGATTFQERTVAFSNGDGQIPNVLVAVCDHCEKVVATPQQSMPRIREAAQKVRKSLEARIPRHLEDVWINSCDQLGLSPEEAKPALFRFYVKYILDNQVLVKKMKVLSSSEEGKGQANARLSIKWSESSHENFCSLVERAGLDQSRLVRGIFVQMKHDLLDGKCPKVTKNLGDVLRQIA